MNQPRGRKTTTKKKNARKGRRKTGKRTIEITQKRFARAHTHGRIHTANRLSIYPIKVINCFLSLPTFSQRDDSRVFCRRGRVTVRTALSLSLSRGRVAPPYTSPYTLCRSAALRLSGGARFAFLKIKWRHTAMDHRSGRNCRARAIRLTKQTVPRGRRVSLLRARASVRSQWRCATEGHRDNWIRAERGSPRSWMGYICMRVYVGKREMRGFDSILRGTCDRSRDPEREREAYCLVRSQEGDFLVRDFFDAASRGFKVG